MSTRAPQPPVADAALTGTVRSFNAEKGYGFLRPDDATLGDLFVHVTAVAGKQPLELGDTVAFRVGADRDGRPCAVDVRLTAVAP